MRLNRQAGDRQEPDQDTNDRTGEKTDRSAPVLESRLGKRDDANRGLVLYVAGIDSVSRLGVFTLNAVSADYFATMGTPILRGRGFTASDGLLTFKGIPFARPPVGLLRWRAPQPVEPWKGVRPATGFGPRCMQLPIFSDMVFRANGMGEDCLYLNVWAPAGARAGAATPTLP